MKLHERIKGINVERRVQVQKERNEGRKDGKGGGNRAKKSHWGVRRYNKVEE